MAYAERAYSEKNAPSSLGACAPVEASEIPQGCSRIGLQLGSLYDNVRLLRERLDPVIEVRPTVSENSAHPTPCRNSPLGTSLHGYADGLEDVNSMLQALVNELAL